jgi:hypothetical protein
MPNDQADDDAEDIAIKDADRDSLHILPLSIVPIQTTALRRARLIKNARLEGVVEIFDDIETGSGQVGIDGLPKDFDWPNSPPHPDLILLRQLGLLPSYDVYSLRILLRDNDIPIKDHKALQLSEAKKKELTDYMRTFTRPLIMEIYGKDDMEIQNFEHVIALFRDPDVEKAREKLEMMAKKLDIRIAELPKFLEDYGDVFLSLSYYRRCLDEIEPIISSFLDALDELRQNYQLKTDANFINTSNMMTSTVNGLMVAITKRFERFDRSTKDMWDNISADRFREVEKIIKSYHTTIGGELCALSVKMNAWAKIFPRADAGGPVKRSDFIMSEMRQGIDKIRKIEANAPKSTEPDAA